MSDARERAEQRAEAGRVSKSQRMAPFYCPYCAEEDLEPYGEEAGTWYCFSCARAFSLSFVGVGARV